MIALMYDYCTISTYSQFLCLGKVKFPRQLACLCAVNPVLLPLLVLP